jgi:hypothetical protein
MPGAEQVNRVAWQTQAGLMDRLTTLDEKAC